MCRLQKKGSIASSELASAPQNTPFLWMILAAGLHIMAGLPGNYCVGVPRAGKTTSVCPVVCLARGSGLEIISGEVQIPSGDALSLLNYSVATTKSVVQAVKLSSVVFRVNKLNVNLCRPTQAAQHRADLSGQRLWEGRQGPGWHDHVAPMAGKPASPQDTQPSLRALTHLRKTRIVQGHFILSEELLLEEHEVVCWCCFPSCGLDLEVIIQADVVCGQNMLLTPSSAIPECNRTEQKGWRV